MHYTSISCRCSLTYGIQYVGKCAVLRWESLSENAEIANMVMLMVMRVTFAQMYSMLQKTLQFNGLFTSVVSTELFHEQKKRKGISIYGAYKLFASNNLYSDP